MNEIAEFYGFKVSMDSSFQGTPNVLIDYEEDGISGHYDLEKGQFTDAVFPGYLVRVVQEWAADNIQILRAMWDSRKIAVLPSWE